MNNECVECEHLKKAEAAATLAWGIAAIDTSVENRGHVERAKLDTSEARRRLAEHEQTHG